MIRTISKLKNLGVFSDYVPEKGLNTFERFNLFYGWNGSGKSTLSKLFWSLNQQSIHPAFPTTEFKLLSMSCGDISNKAIVGHGLNIRVFNKDFIDKNVNFEDSKANSIIILSEEKKEELDKYKALLATEKELKSDLAGKASLLRKLEEDLGKKLSAWASQIKQSFTLIETTNTYLLNYDKTKLNKFIIAKAKNISSEAIISDEEVAALKKAINPNKRPDIALAEVSLIKIDEILLITNNIIASLEDAIVSKRIQRLVDDAEINSWVLQGLDIHINRSSTECEFCSKPLEKSRIDELNMHFNDAYLRLMKSLHEFLVLLEGYIAHVERPIPETLSLYEEFQDDYQIQKLEIEKSQIECAAMFASFLERVTNKIANPFLAYSHEKLSVEKLEKFNSAIEAALSVAQKHNLKNTGFDDALKNALSVLELHFVSKILSEGNYDGIKQQIEDLRSLIQERRNELDLIEGNIQELEKILLNETIGAENFNESLQRFIGRSEIKLEFDKELKGYKLIRGNVATMAINLSEGEKTAIAFVYFISKLKENGNVISDTIVVVDDPISSFDSNHLFHSYSYLKKECEAAKQLFIFTHNFNYFKLVRDWLIGKNKTTKLPDGSYEEKIRSRFYAIECTIDIPRKALIKNANLTLLKYNSEYHYIFDKLNGLLEIKELDLEKAFLIANLSRKLLEGFLSFKFPKFRNDFNQLLTLGCTDSDIKEKVYRFINKYSHNQTIEFHETPIDNLLGEGNNIVIEVFGIMEKLDERHYNEMKELIVA
jgi:wobble nucleotide-excising tRNase